jgi:hypothetical protein
MSGHGLDLACAVLARAVELVGVDGCWSARRRARQILDADRAGVESLARRLLEHGELTF